MNGVPLAGAYSHDDEGVPSQRVSLIQDGILKNFLMSRMPITNFDKSNGHGRHQAGFMPTGRQGNLIVQSTKTVKDSEMRAQLIEEVKKEGKPYGLYFEDVQGGFTLTTRELPQAFQVLPVIVWRVYPDGRPDQLVRGVDIVGTPLASLNRIVAYRRHDGSFQRNLRRGIGQRSGIGLGARHAVQRNGSAEAQRIARASSDPAAAGI